MDTFRRDDYIALTRAKGTVIGMKKNPLSAWLIAVGAAFVANVCLAAEPAAAVPAGLTKTLQERYPEIQIVDVRPSPLPGLYEIFTGAGIVYADGTGDHLLAGPLIDTRTRRNLTSDRVDERNTINFSALPLDLAIKSVKGDGRRRMAVFADPDCPFCKKLEKALISVDNVTVYVFLYPIPELHPGAVAKARKIWCSADRATTWTTWMREGTLAGTNEDCKPIPLDELQALAGKLHVAGTPTIFFPSGRRVGVALTAPEIEKLLDSEAAAPVEPPHAAVGKKPAPASAAPASAAAEVPTANRF